MKKQKDIHPARRSRGESPRRLRRQPEEVRSCALDATRRLLLTHGPDAITLKNVAKELGMTHTNLIHHFGSAAGLQSALMSDMATTLADTLQDVVKRVRAGTADVREFVDIVFDAFNSGGAGRLAAWLMMSGNAALLSPVGAVLQEFLQMLEAGSRVNPDLMADLHRRFTTAILFVVIAAFGDAILGDTMHDMLTRERNTVRDTLKDFLPQISGLVHEREVKE